jgi:hypothetical protein
VKTLVFKARTAVISAAVSDLAGSVYPRNGGLGHGPGNFHARIVGDEHSLFTHMAEFFVQVLF